MSLRDQKCVKPAGGFTLVELVVAMAITVTISALLITISGSVLETYGRTAGRIQANAEARIALETIVTDLQSLVFRQDGNAWFVAEITNSDQNTLRGDPMAKNLWRPPGFSTRQKPDGDGAVNLAQDRYGQNGVWLRFFARPPDRDRQTTTGGTIPGDICAVAYQLLRRGATIAAEGTGTADTAVRFYGLYRTVVNADRTFESGYDLVEPTSDYWVGSNTNLLGEPVEVIRPDRSLLLAADVVEFGVKFFDENLQEIPYATGTSSVLLEYVAPKAQPIPAFIDVYLRVLTKEGADTILAFEQGKIRTDLTTKEAREQFWWETAVANSIEYRRRLAINWRQAL